MAAFTYKALGPDGKITKGLIEGDSERQVRALLRGKQLKPVEVVVSTIKSSRNSDRLGWNLLKSRMSQVDHSLLTRQLSTLVQSNMPLDEALSTVAKQTRKNNIKTLVLQVRSRILEGHSLAYALGDFPRVFDEMYRAMVHVGESTGYLGGVLGRLADYIENNQYTRHKLKLAMLYPLILMLVTITVVVLLMVYVVPQLVSLFAHSQVELPRLTSLLIEGSNFIQQSGWVVLLVMVATVVSLKQLHKNPRWRKAWHRLVLKLPFISRFITSVDSARFASTLSILVSSGVSLLDGLRIAGEVISNLSLREASKNVAESVQEGISLNKALEETDMFPPMMVQMVASGEASGELETMLTRCASNQERELEVSISSMLGIIEPLMIIVMAVVVGTMVIAILLPIIEMNNLVV